MKTGTQLIAEERERQVTYENFDATHDDSHKNGELAQAATAYIRVAKYQAVPHVSAKSLGSYAWPFEDGYNPSTNAIRNLVKAGALLAAEIDRLQRAAQ